MLNILLLVLITTIWVAFEIWLVIRDASRGKGKTVIDKGTRYFNFIAIAAGITGAAILNGVPKFFFPGGRTNMVFFIGIAVIPCIVAQLAFQIAEVKLGA